MIRNVFLGTVSVFVLATAVSANGCAAAEEESGAAGQNATGRTDDGVWSECPLHFDEPNGPRAECATFDVPLKWNADGTKGQDDRTIAIFAQRLRGKGKGQHKQLWMLQGGPGAPGSFFSHDMEHLATLDENVDFYTLDHRGMGRSERIGCPQEDVSSEGGFTITEAERSACDLSVAKKWGHDLGAFSTTFAARDLHALIERTRAPGQKLFVFGVSYGTHFAHRYLQLYPTQPTGVIFDGVAVNMKFDEKDAVQNLAAKDFIDYCKTDDFCRSKIGGDGDAWAELGRVFPKIEDPTFACASLKLTKKFVRVALMTLIKNFHVRPIVPAFIHRLARCNAEDKAALAHLVALAGTMGGKPGAQARLTSSIAGDNIILGDMWRGRSEADVERDYEAALVAHPHTMELAAMREEHGQKFGPYLGAEGLVDRWAATNVPILLMNGDLDPQTVWQQADLAARKLKERAPNRGVYQHYFKLPRALHGLLSESPVRTPGAEQCGTQLLVSFLKNPTRRPSAACLDDIEPIDFNVPPSVAKTFFGTENAWGSD